MEAEAVRPKPFSLPQILSAVVQPDRMSVMSMPGVASVWSDAVEYWIDAARRTILYWDVMRQRGNHYHEQQKRTALSMLSFEHELIMDGRALPRPVNYMLVRITPPQGVIDPARVLLADAQGGPCGLHEAYRHAAFDASRSGGASASGGRVT